MATGMSSGNPFDPLASTSISILLQSRLPVGFMHAHLRLYYQRPHAPGFPMLANRRPAGVSCVRAGIGQQSELVFTYALLAQHVTCACPWGLPVYYYHNPTARHHSRPRDCPGQ